MRIVNEYLRTLSEYDIDKIGNEIRSMLNAPRLAVYVINNIIFVGYEPVFNITTRLPVVLKVAELASVSKLTNTRKNKINKLNVAKNDLNAIEFKLANLDKKYEKLKAEERKQLEAKLAGANVKVTSLSNETYNLNLRITKLCK